MARLPNRNVLGSSPPRYRGGMVDYGGLGNANAAIGGALDNLGTEVARSGAAIEAALAEQQKVREQTERFAWTTKRMQFEDTADQIYREAADEAEPGAAGFADRVVAAFDLAARDFVSEAPEHMRPTIDQRLYAKRSAVQDSARRFETEEHRRFFGNQLEDGSNTLIRKSIANPDMLKEMEEEGLALIDNAPHLSDIEKDATKRKFRQTIQEQTLLSNVGAPNRRVGTRVSPGSSPASAGPAAPSGTLQVTSHVRLSDRAGEAEYQGVAPSLRHILEETSRRTGVRVEIRSGKEARGGGGHHPKGDALDVWLLDRDGNRIDHGAGGTGDRPELSSSKRGAARNFALYEQYAREARHVQRELYPELNDQFRWGGYFGGGPSKYGALDTMHFDLGGSAMAGGSWATGLHPSQVRAWEAAGYSFEYGQLDAIRVDPQGGGDHWRGDPSAPRGLRNNNPGNLRDGQIARRTSGYRGADDGGFAQFETPEQGLHAMARLLGGYERDGQTSIRAVLEKYAPSTENDTESYINKVAAALGLDPDADFSFTSDRNLALGLMQEMIQHENGEMPYAPEQIAAAYDTASVGAPAPAGTIAPEEGGEIQGLDLGPEYDAVSPAVFRQAQKRRAAEITKLERERVEEDLGSIAADVARSENYEQVIENLVKTGRLTRKQAREVEDQAALLNTAARLQRGDVFNTEDSTERKKLDDVFSRVANEAGLISGDEAALQATDAFVRRANYIPKAARTAFGSLLKSQDPETFARGVELGSMLEAAAPTVFTLPTTAGGLNERDRRRFDMARTLTAYFGPEQAIERIKAPVSKTLDKEIDKELKDHTAADVALEFDDSWWSSPRVASRRAEAIESLYREIYGEFRAQGADPDTARESTQKAMDRRWGITRAAGHQQFMEFPPEKVFGAPSEWVSRQLKSDLSERYPDVEMSNVMLVTVPATTQAINAGDPQVPWMVVEQPEGGVARTLGHFWYDHTSAFTAEKEKAARALTRNRDAFEQGEEGAVGSVSEIGASLFGAGGSLGQATAPTGDLSFPPEPSQREATPAQRGESRRTSATATLGEVINRAAANEAPLPGGPDARSATEVNRVRLPDRSLGQQTFEGFSPNLPRRDPPPSSPGAATLRRRSRRGGS